MKLNKNFYIAISFWLLVCGLFLPACKQPAPNAPAAETFREVTDDLGKKVKIPAKIERAVSLAPSLTEMIFAVGAGDKLVGDTTYCDYPEAAQKIQKVGDTLNPNVEAIIALKPQIVFVSTASQLEAFTKTLDNQNIAVFVTNPNSFEDIQRNLKQFGEIFATADQAAKLIIEQQKRIAAVEEKTKDKPKPKIFVQIDKDSLYTIGKDSFITDLIKRAGGESVTKDVEKDYPKLSKETALALNPDVIILSESPTNNEPNDVFKNSPAMKNGKVFKVNADLLSRPATRLVDALEQIARDLHPESF